MDPMDRRRADRRLFAAEGFGLARSCRPTRALCNPSLHANSDDKHAFRPRGARDRDPSTKNPCGNWSSEVVLKRNQELITTGVYGYVRHPIYTGVLLMALGSGLSAGTILAFLPFLALLFFFWFKSKGEEELLTEHFPREYPAYKRRVKALIPYVF